MLQKENERLVVDHENNLTVRLRMGKWRIEFSHGECIAELAIEPVTNPLQIIVYSESLETWTVPPDTPLSDDEKSSVLQTVASALEILKCPHQIV